ncbi:unnamed protein product [Candidula unifasciata]|uniref:SPRY domain-containing SOCS box protein 3 n=1 Tax=Candidula unifasciata TaxID=100452 RepID=A0A8S3ZHF6_9EUPU|nr:unnamed protein product [Candidula unifasciata]
MAQGVRSLAMFMDLHNDVSKQTATFCKCVPKQPTGDCRCGEDDKHFEWVWDHIQRGEATSLQEQGSHVTFHKDFSCGTTAIRGLQAMDRDQHFWEIKMTTPVYGTDMMIGVGTDNVELNKFHNTFCSMLGSDVNSWGISYDGHIQHAGKKQKYCGKFGQGTIIGVHLDMWHGTMTYFKDRECLGVAFKGLRGRTLYPMASSTAARSGMRVISARSFPSSLQFMCCQKLRQVTPGHLRMLDVLPMPPGLRLFLANNMAWFLHIPPLESLKRISRYTCHICKPLTSILENTCTHSKDRGYGERISSAWDFFSDIDTEDKVIPGLSTESADRSLQHETPSICCRMRSSSSHSEASSSSSSSGSNPGWAPATTRKRKLYEDTHDEDKVSEEDSIDENINVDVEEVMEDRKETKNSYYLVKRQKFEVM